MRRYRGLALVASVAISVVVLGGCGDDDGQQQQQCGDGVCEGTETLTNCPQDCEPCGNGVLDPGESCDGTEFGGETCESLGHGGGELYCNADCSINDVTACCDHGCPAVGDTQCDGDALQACEVSADGCRAWVDQVDCAAGNEVCVVRNDTAVCEGACTDECSTQDDTQCDGSVIQTCTVDAIDGCLYWVDGVDCAGTGELCEDATGSAVCTDTCVNECTTLTDQQCGTDVVEECQLGSDGCNDWVTVDDCAASSETCVDTTGTPLCCAHECPVAGDQQCNGAGDAVQVCTVGTEGCRQWQLDSTCSAGTFCQQNGTTAQCDNGAGEDCTAPFVLSSGQNAVSWTATTADYLTAAPQCVSSSYSIDGPDVVMSYTATVTGFLDFNVINKPASTRWAMVVSSGACGVLTPEEACVSEYSPTSMGDIISTTAGQTYYFYIADTTSGTNPLSNPFDIVINEVDCTNPNISITDSVPTVGATEVLPNSPIVVNFSTEMNPDLGTVTLTGTGSTNLTYDLSLNPAEVSFTNNNTTMVVTPGAVFDQGETVTVTLAGLQDVLCVAPLVSTPWSFDVATQLPGGENCTDPLILTPGDNTYSWYGTVADWFTSTPCGSSYSVDGADVVGVYTATVNGYVDVEMQKPASNRMFMTAFESACGDLSAELACENDYSPTSLSMQFRVTAGQSYHLYFADTTSGTQALPNPLQLNIQETDCSTEPPANPVSATPTHGATNIYMGEDLVVTFDQAMVTDEGVVTITGTGGTNVSYDLTTAPPEVSWSNGDMTATLNPSVFFAPGETVTVTWSGILDAQCGNAVPVVPWSFDVQTASPGVGENCFDPLTLAAGTYTYAWTASHADWFTTTPCGSSYSVDGPDVVGEFVASVDGYVSIDMQKPTSARMFMTAYEAPCGDLSTVAACAADFSPASLSMQFPVITGQSYFVYFADTTSGADPLPNPLDLTITETDCTPFPAAVASNESPVNGATGVSVAAALSVDFDKVLRTDRGTVSVVGNMGTSYTFDLSTSPSEVAWSGGDQTMTITLPANLGVGETVSVSWMGLVDAECGKAVPSPTWTFETQLSIEPGEDCSMPIALQTGDATYAWFANQQDYFTAVPCGSSTLTGGDVVGVYTATVNGYLDVTMNKPSNQRMFMLISDATCGDVTTPLDCISDYGPTLLNLTVPVTAGADYYVYISDTASGTGTLPDPLELVITEVDCGAFSSQPVTLLPGHGSVTSSLTPTFTATFDIAPATTDGTVIITGDLGTSLSYAVTASEVDFSNGDLTMTIDPGVSLPAGENLTITWTGMVDSLCGNAISAPVWDVTVITPPCQPGVGGVVGTTQTNVPLGATFTSEYYVAADSDPNGWVYVGHYSSLYRVPKAGGAYEDVDALAGLTTSHLGYGGMVINGSDIFVIDDSSSGTTGKLWRISSDGGATWVVEDFAVFPSAPTDDIRSAMAWNGRIYMMTHESTSSVGTQIWSVSASPSSLPDTAVLEGSFTGEANCSGFSADDHNFYIVCDTGNRVIQVAQADAPNYQPVLVTDAVSNGYSTNSLFAVDTDSDGTADVLYVHGDTSDIHYVCDPTGVAYTDILTTVGSVNWGMGFDKSANTLWVYDDGVSEFVSVQ